jgi:biopolymer transport protein ExbD
MSKYKNNKRSFLRDSSTSASISLTPLIDTFMTLLVIFMVTTPLVQQSIKVDLPQGAMNEVVAKSREKDSQIYIDAQKNIYWQDEKIAKNQLLNFLKKWSVQHPQQVVFVYADRSVDYGTVLELVDTIKDVGGVSYVALATTKATRPS